MSPRKGRSRLRRWVLLGVAALMALLLSASVALAAPGDLDSTFGSAGKQTINFGGTDRATHVAITPDGRYVVIGTTCDANCAVGTADFAIARFTSAGQLDSSFGSGGKQSIGTQANVDDIGAGIAVLPDERIVISGQGNTTADFVTKRLNADGTLDTSFGSGGTSVVDFGGAETENAMIQQPDGKLVLVGSTSVGGGDFAIVRLNADGTPDTSFSGDGKQTHNFGASDVAIAAALQPDGKLVVVGAGGSSSDMAATRFNADGSIDTSFGLGGEVYVNFGGTDVANGVAVQADGRIVLAGTTSAVGSGDIALARLNTDGSLDTSFSGDGMLTSGYGAANESGLAVAIQQNQKIVVMGDGDATSDFVLSRFNPDGGGDPSFGFGDTVSVNFGRVEYDGDVAIAPDGQLVIAGSTNVSDGGDIAMARLQGDPVQAPGSSTTTTAPPITPPTTPSSTPPSPQNVVAPLIRRLITSRGPTGTYYCDPGEWTNLPSPPGFSYRWIATENGKPVTITQRSSYIPTNADYGYPISCQVTVQGPTQPISATSNLVFFTSAGMNKLPPAYGDIRVKGIDVFQVVQPNAQALAYGYPSGAFGVTCGGGTPTAYFTGGLEYDYLCTPGRDNPQQAMQQADYQGVQLDSDKPTTAVVYLNTVDVPPQNPSLPIAVELSATSNGQSLGDPLVGPAPDLQASDSPTVTATERGTGGNFVEFKLPSAWTAAGNLKLSAHVVFPKPDFGPAYGAHQCASPNDPPANNAFVLAFFPPPNCDTDDTFTLDKIPFQQFTKLPNFQAVQLLTHAQARFTQTPDQVMAAAKYLYPGGEHFIFQGYSPWSIDIDAASKTTVDSAGNCLDQNGNKTGKTAMGGQATRVCRWYAVDALMSQWVAMNPARQLLCATNCVKLRMYDAVLGVSHYDSGAGGAMLGCPAGSFCPEPGYQHPVGNNIKKVTAAGPSPASTGWLIVDTKVHPVQGSTHELGHWLTLPHAGSETGPCANPQLNETWPGDDSGRIQSARFNPLRGWRATPQVDGTPADRKIFDLMSYCGDFLDRRPKPTNVNPAAYPGNTWLSARNWNRVVSVLNAFAKRIGNGSVAVPGDVVAHVARQSSTAFAVGTVGPAGGSIDRVVPSDSQDSVPPSVAGSPYRLRSLGAGGRVLLDAGVTSQLAQDIKGASQGTFVGPVAPGATALELVYGGRVLARKDRSHPPQVKLVLPRGGIHLRHGQSLGLRWRASDPDTKKLQVTVDVSSDSKIWRSAYIGTNRGRFTLPAAAFAASQKARVRVTVNDGFSAAGSTSPAFTALGTPPHAEIIAPVTGDTALAGQPTRLVATAVDDQGQPLPGRSLTWYAGRRRLGFGTTLKTRLPGGSVILRLVAQSSGGNRRTVTQRLTVTARRLRVTGLSVPQRVNKGAKTVTIVVQTSTPSKLTVGHRHYTVRTRLTRIKLGLPSKPAVGVVKVPFTLSPSSRSVTGRIRGSVWVIRT